MEKEALRISVRLEGELVKKMNAWRGYGLTLSDIVRQAIALMPDPPAQIDAVKNPPEPPRQERRRIQPEDRENALKTLQDW